MSTRREAERVACAKAGVDYKAFKTGRLTPKDKKKLFDILRELARLEKR